MGAGVAAGPALGSLAVPGPAVQPYGLRSRQQNAAQVTTHVKIRGAESAPAHSEHLGPGYETRLKKALADRGLSMEGIFVRPGCIEVVLGTKAWAAAKGQASADGFNATTGAGSPACDAGRSAAKACFRDTSTPDAVTSSTHACSKRFTPRSSAGDNPAAWQAALHGIGSAGSGGCNGAESGGSTPPQTHTQSQSQLVSVAGLSTKISFPGDASPSGAHTASANGTTAGGGGGGDDSRTPSLCSTPCSSSGDNRAVRQAAVYGVAGFTGSHRSAGDNAALFGSPPAGGCGGCGAAGAAYGLRRASAGDNHAARYAAQQFLGAGAGAGIGAAAAAAGASPEASAGPSPPIMASPFVAPVQAQAGASRRTSLAAARDAHGVGYVRRSESVTSNATGLVDIGELIRALQLPYTDDTLDHEWHCDELDGGGRGGDGSGVFAAASLLSAARGSGSPTSAQRLHRLQLSQQQQQQLQEAQQSDSSLWPQLAESQLSQHQLEQPQHQQTQLPLVAADWSAPVSPAAAAAIDMHTLLIAAVVPRVLALRPPSALQQTFQQSRLYADAPAVAASGDTAAAAAVAAPGRPSETHATLTVYMPGIVSGPAQASGAALDEGLGAAGAAGTAPAAAGAAGQLAVEMVVRSQGTYLPATCTFVPLLLPAGTPTAAPPYAAGGGLPHAGAAGVGAADSAASGPAGATSNSLPGGATGSASFTACTLRLHALPPLPGLLLVEARRPGGGRGCVVPVLLLDEPGLAEELQAAVETWLGSPKQLEDVFMDLGAFFHHLPAALRVLAQRRYRDALGLPAAAGAIAGTAAATGLGSGPAPGYQAADQAQLHFQLEQQQHQQAAWLAGTPAAAATAASAAALLLPDPASELMRARLIDMGLHMLGWFAAAPANTWPLTLARLRSDVLALGANEADMRVIFAAESTAAAAAAATTARSAAAGRGAGGGVRAGSVSVVHAGMDSEQLAAYYLGGSDYEANSDARTDDVRWLDTDDFCMSGTAGSGHSGVVGSASGFGSGITAAEVARSGSEPSPRFASSNNGAVSSAVVAAAAVAMLGAAGAGVAGGLHGVGPSGQASDPEYTAFVGEWAAAQESVIHVAIVMLLMLLPVRRLLAMPTPPNVAGVDGAAGPAAVARAAPSEATADSVASTTLQQLRDAAPLLLVLLPHLVTCLGWIAMGAIRPHRAAYLRLVRAACVLRVLCHAAAAALVGCFGFGFGLGLGGDGGGGGVSMQQLGGGVFVCDVLLLGINLAMDPASAAAHAVLRLPLLAALWCGLEQAPAANPPARVCLRAASLSALSLAVNLLSHWLLQGLFAARQRGRTVGAFKQSKQ
eukprot:XP_001691744.1 predicted protein [Chlamydomonas reinhardtii]